MRNLKRALSLALAAVMLVGMMVVSASAVSIGDFSDSEKITNTEAVSVLTSLKVINGKDDGSFDPTGIVTRAEMAKMICVVLNGGKDPNLGTTTSVTYKDTASNWASAYIEYCTNRGIVSGDGNGNFNPTKTVTGTEAAKMLLVALGYNAKHEGMIGAQWDVATGVLANKNDLYTDLDDLDPSAGLTRDDAAQMIYNALDAEKVKYTNALVTDDNGTLTSIPTVEGMSGKTLLTEEFKAVKVEGVVTANEFASVTNATAGKEGETTVKVTNHGEGQNEYSNASHTFKVTSGADVLGHAVYMYIKPGTSDAKAIVLGSVIVDADAETVVTTTAKKTNAKMIELLDDNGLKTDGDTKASVNFGTPDTKASFADNDSVFNKKGVALTIIDNDNDGKVDYIFQVEYNLGKVTKYSTKDDGSLTLNGSSKLAKDAEDVVGFEDVKKDDYVLYAEIGGKLYVEKAASVTGNLDRVKKGEALTVEGTKYDVSGVAFYEDDNLEAATDYNNPGVSATFYMDKFGNIVAVGEAEEAAANYAIVLGYDPAGNKIDDPRIRLLMADGTKATYYVDEIQTRASDDKSWKEVETYPNSDDLIGELVAYTMSDSKVNVRIANDENELGGDTYVTTESAATYTFKKERTAVVLGSETFYADNNTVFFYAEAAAAADVDKADVYTGYKNAPTPKTENVVFRAIAEDDDLKAVVVYGAGSKAAGDYLYLYNYLGSDNKNSYFDAIIDGQLVEDITVADNDLSKDSYGLYEYTINADGKYDLSTATGDSYVGSNKADAQAVTRVSGNSVFVGGEEYILNDSSVVALIDGGDTALDETVEKGDKVVMVVDDDKIEALFITEEAKEETTPTTPTDPDKGDDGDDGEEEPPKTETVAVTVKVDDSVEGYTATVEPATVNKSDAEAKATVTVTGTLTEGKYTIAYKVGTTEATAEPTAAAEATSITFEVTIGSVTEDVAISITAITAPEAVSDGGNG